MLRDQLQHTRDMERENGQIIPWVFHRGGKQIRNMFKAWDTACTAAGLPG